GDQDLVLAADVGAPVDVQIVAVYLGKRAPGVQHHDDIVGVAGKTAGEQPAGRDVHGPPGPGQADLVLGRERLDAADARDHLQLEGDRAAGQHLVEDVHGAVVDRRVAP